MDYFTYIYLGEINMNEIKQQNVLINTLKFVVAWISVHKWEITRRMNSGETIS